jgi:hypothetical protein
MNHKKAQTMVNEESKDIRDLIHHGDYSRSMDLRGEPIGDVCVCGSEIFIALVAFQNKEISFYFLDGECASCGSMVTLPYPENTENG